MNVMNWLMQIHLLPIDNFAALDAFDEFYGKECHGKD
jgi:hypothetical protein